jgi:hypothetical protein
MEMPVIVNAAGLVFDIVGAIGLFVFGLPRWIPHNVEELVIDGGDIDAERDLKPKPDPNTKWARGSLALLVLGFALQLLSNFLRS